MMHQDTTLRFGLAGVAKGYCPADRRVAGASTGAERRRSARVRKLVMALPDDGAVVIVHSPSIIGVFRDLIRDLRGNEVAALTRVVAAPSVADERTVLRGLSLPVFRDHFVEEQREYSRAVMQAWRL